jgi:hypothetical protein
MSGGGVLATYLVSLAPGIEPRQAGSTAVPAVSVSGAVDLSAQADRLRARVGQVPPYREPARDVFHFGATPRRVSPAPVVRALETPPPAPSSPKPLFSLAGVASESSDGVTERTAILSSIHGVLLVHDGDSIEGGFRVVTIEDDAVTVESTSDGTLSTLRLSGSDGR